LRNRFSSTLVSTIDCARTCCVIRSDPATIYDVARLAGVSPSTVSHVLNSTRKVSLATRRRVEDAIDALSYRPNDTARMLRAGHAKLIGLVLPDLSNTYFADLARALEMLAYEQGARLLTCNSDYERDREAAYVDDLVRRRVDGILIAPVAPDAEVEAALQKTGVPVILIDRVSQHSTLPSIGIDNAAAAALAAEHLYSLGHRRIGCICAQPGLAESVDQRTRGFIDGLARLGIALPETAIACADFKISGGMEAASRLLAACPDLTAIFCANDPMAVGAVKAAAAAGRAVPEDLSIIGFDDSLEAQVSQPPLTTVAQPIEEIAAGAMALLRGGGKGEQRVRLSARLVTRQSAAQASNHAIRSGDTTSPAAVGRNAGRRPARACKRVLIAGAGRIGRVHARALAQVPGAVIAGFSDPDAARAAALASEFGTTTFSQVEAALASGDVDAIIVGSSSDTHLDLVRCAAQQGVHVFCEKPLALTAADIAAAITACEDAGVILQVGFNRRFDPNVAEISGSVRSGRIGKPLSIRIVSRDPAPPSREFLRRSGGLFHDMAIHDFDLASYILGEEVIEVMAIGGCLIDPMFAEEGDVDVATTTLRFASGALGVIENTRATPYGYDQRLEVLGTEGALESENQAAHRVIFRGPAGQVAPLPLPFFLERYETAFQYQMQAFVGLIASAAPRPEPVVSGKDALRAHLIAEAATASLRSGRPARVAVPGT
jgi:myo-inositol 2-dehydrogenase/D-chiro-inositol 1-dehydrogenase